MFRKRKPEPQARQAAKAAVKLTAAEKREISRILETARGDGKVHSAQDTFRFGEARKFTMADKFCAVSFLQISAPEMDDRMLTELLDTDSGLLVSLHIRSMDQNEAIKTVKRKITDIDSMKIDAQKKAVREGFDMDIIPTDLATYAGEAKNILRDLQSRNERMFLMTFLVVNFADSGQKLENDLLRAASVAQKYNCSLVRLDFQQEDGFVSALPLGVNRIKIQRGLTTSAVAVFVPFTTQEIFHGGEALYYGLNATSGNMILADRKKLKTPNGMILGTPGSGKSFSAKRSIVGVFLNTKDDILICDPEAEYFPLVNRLEGQVIKISPTSTQYVNPMDINLNYSEDDNPLALKSDFILSFCELAAGGRNGLEPVEKTVIDRAVRIIYRPYIADPRPENMPLLEDLYDEIKRQPEPEAQRIAAALELYVHGSLNVFNHRTNVDINNRIVCSLRMGEILGLTWENVHISDEDIAADNAYVYIDKELTRASKRAIETLGEKDIYYIFTPLMPNTSTRIILKKPKTDSSIRKVWLPKTLAYILREWKKSQDELKGFLGDEYQDFDLVVALPNGRPCEDRIILKEFAKLREDAGLPKVVFHSLRHSSTTYKLKLNHGDLKATQGDTGHAEIDMITSIYAHILDEDRKVNAQKFETAFYAKPDLRNVRPPEEPAKSEPATLDLESLVEQLQKSPELASALAALIAAQAPAK